MNKNTGVPTIEEVLNYDYNATTLEDRSALFARQDENLFIVAEEVRELRRTTFTMHALVTIAEHMRHNGTVGGQSVSAAQIAKALRSNGKRMTMAKQLIESNPIFSTLLELDPDGRRKGKYIVRDEDVVEHVRCALLAEVGGRSLESLHKRYVTDVVTDEPTDEPTDDDGTDDDVDSFDPNLAFATAIAACRKRGMANDEITNLFVAAMGS